MTDSTHSRSTLSVLIPVYDERYTVEQLIEEVQGAPMQDGVSLELVVVNDASTDGTGDVLESLAAESDSIRLIHHPENRGKGAAIRTAIEHATGDYMIIQDGDLEYSPEEYPRLLEPLLDGTADAVYGSRFMPRDRKRVLFFWHSVGNRFLTLLSNVCTNLDLTDMETCYKMVRGGILRSIPIRSDRFGIEPELTAKLAKRGCRIYEVPISYRGRGYEEGKKITWRDGVSAIYTILRFRLVDDLYNEAYGHDILHSLSRAHRLNRWMAETIEPWVGDHVLEIGAGMGNLSMKLLPRLSYTPSDVDPLHLDFLRNHFANNARVHVKEADLAREEHFQALAGSYDTVVCLNVVEHVEDDRLAMKNIFTALRPGGKACILVPQHPQLYGSLDEVLGHYRRYTKEGLREVLRDPGFRVVELFSFNRVTVPGWYWNARILKRKHFGRIQLKLFDSLVWLWRRIDRFIPWGGTSLIAIVERPEES